MIYHPASFLSPFKGILFDLDGTLLDTAPSILDGLAHTLSSYHLPIPDDMAEKALTVFSHGLTAMLEVLMPEHDITPEHHACFYAYHKKNFHHKIKYFSDIPVVLKTLDEHHIPWGIVTNKLTHMTESLLPYFEALRKTHCLICADTTPHKKPHPAPVLEACQRLNIPPAEVLFLGDAKQDILAGQHAGTRTAVVTYGYLPKDYQNNPWKADFHIQAPLDLLSS